VIDSGGSATNFLNRESEKYVERANDEQEDFLETLSLVSEIYLALLVAGPLSILVGLLAVAILGGEVVNQIYVLIPLFSAMMVLVVDFFAKPFERTGWKLKMEDDRVE